MELWWNNCGEGQAASRVYRMGQKKEVHVVRLLCQVTREDEILEMQNMKDKELRDCLMPRTVTKSNHSVHSIFSLLGMPRTKNGIVVGLGERSWDHLPDSSKARIAEEGDAEVEEGQDGEECESEGNSERRGDSKAEMEVEGDGGNRRGKKRRESWKARTRTKRDPWKGIRTLERR